MNLRTTDYFNFLFLHTTALRKFAHRSGFNRIVAQCPFFEGKAVTQAAGNRLTFLKSRKAWLGLFSITKTQTIYYLTAPGMAELKTILLNPKTYYSNNPRMAAWIQQVGLTIDQLPEKAFNPSQREFRAHEQICDDLSTAWTSVIGRPIELTREDRAAIRGKVEFAWCQTELSISADWSIVGKTSMSPDVLLFVNFTVSGQRFTRVAALEVEVSTRDCVEKLKAFARWFFSGEFRRYYRSQQSIFPLVNSLSPPLVVGFVFPTAHDEEKARHQLQEVTLSNTGRDCGKYHLPDNETGLSLCRTSHAGLDFARDSWKSLTSDNRAILFS